MESTCNIKSKLDELMLQVESMRSTRGDVQRQFELLYYRISQIKGEFDSYTGYDSSGNNTESEYETDDAIENGCLDNNPSTELYTEEKTRKHNDDKEEEGISDSFKTLNETENDDDTMFEVSTNNDSSLLLTPEDKFNNNEHMADKNENLTIHDKRLLHWNTDNTVSQDCSQFSKKAGNFEIRNLSEGTGDATGSNNLKEASGCDVSGLVGARSIGSSCDHVSKSTSFYKFNIKPRRPLHEQSVKYLFTEPIEDFATKPLNDNYINTCNTLKLAETNSEYSSVDDETSEDSDIELNFVNFECGLISFNVALDGHVPSYSTDSDVTPSRSESEVDFLHFEDGHVSFDVKSTDYKTDSANLEYDIFSGDTILGIDALFNNDITDSTSETGSLNLKFEETADEYLDGVSKLFEASHSNHYIHVPEGSAPRNLHESEGKTIESDDQPEKDSVAIPDMSLVSQDTTERGEVVDETRNSRLEYSFAGVVLLNALPRILTSSLVSSLFSNPSLSFAFYKPIALRHSNFVSPSDIGKISFSSQELPFRKFYGMAYPASDSHIETLSTKSTNSRDSSLESFCES